MRWEVAWFMIVQCLIWSLHFLSSRAACVGVCMSLPNGSPSADGARDYSAREDAVNVLLAYPKALTGRLIVESLRHNARFKVAGHVSSPEAVSAFVGHTRIDVALIAVDLCGKGDGLDALRRIRIECSELRTIMLLETGDPLLVVESFQLGANGVFAMADSGYDGLCKCILCVHEGQIWANSQELHWVLDALRKLRHAHSAFAPMRTAKVLELNRLSKREDEVVTLLSNGLSNRDIARALNLSENTIKNYLFRIFDKVGVSNRTELLRHALRAPARPGSADLDT